MLAALGEIQLRLGLALEMVRALGVEGEYRQDICKINKGKKDIMSIPDQLSMHQVSVSFKRID